MSLYLVVPGSTIEGAFTTNTTVSAALINSLIEGQGLYQLGLSGAGWVNQGLPPTTFTVSGNVATVVGIGNIVTGTGPCQVSTTGSLPTGLSAATDYWLIATGQPNQFMFATSWANAIAGTNVTLSSAGTGTQTIDTVAAVANGRVFVPAGGTLNVDGRNGGKLAVIQDSTGGKFSLSALISVK